jgi:alpha-1,6-mannosyltransferase
MHICDLTTLYIDGGEGGVNTYLTEKARYFADHGGSYRHTIIVPGATNTTHPLFRSTVYALRSPRFFYNPYHRIMMDFQQLKQLLVEVKPDVIEVDCLYFLGHWARTAMGKRRIPLVGFYHTHLPSFYARPLTQCFGSVVSQSIEALAWAYVAYCMKPLDKVLVASHDIYKRLLENTHKEVEQVPLGVNLNLFQAHQGDAKTPGDYRPVILYIGRLSQEKDLPVLFEAFQLLNRQGAYALRIVGDGPLRAKTERFVRTTPHVIYAGLVPYGKRLAEMYATADILAVPSRNETFGLTVLEALASGIPVVAINQGGPVNLLYPGVGSLAAPGDPVDFAEKLASVLEDTTMRHRCRTYVEQHFSWDKTFGKLLDIYDNLHKAPRPVWRETRMQHDA